VSDEEVGNGGATAARPGFSALVGGGGRGCAFFSADLGNGVNEARDDELGCTPPASSYSKGFGSLNNNNSSNIRFKTIYKTSDEEYRIHARHRL
jgi:hypothetical protein